VPLDHAHRDVHVVAAGQVAGGADESVVVEHIENASDRYEDVVLRDLRLVTALGAFPAASATVTKTAAPPPAPTLGIVFFGPGTLTPVRPVTTVGTLRPVTSLGPLRTLTALRPVDTLATFCPLRTLTAVRPLGTFRTLTTLRTLTTVRPLGTLTASAFPAFASFRTLGPLTTVRPLRTLGTLGHLCPDGLCFPLLDFPLLRLRVRDLRLAFFRWCWTRRRTRWATGPPGYPINHGLHLRTPLALPTDLGGFLYAGRLDPSRDVVASPALLLYRHDKFVFPHPPGAGDAKRHRKALQLRQQHRGQSTAGTPPTRDGCSLPTRVGFGRSTAVRGVRRDVGDVAQWIPSLERPVPPR
jgi:hypothetical protein